MSERGLDEVRQIAVFTLKRNDSDLFVALSDDLPGLFVTGRTEAEIRARLDDSIRALLEAEGWPVADIVTEEDDLPASFAVPPRFRSRVRARSAT